MDIDCLILIHTRVTLREMLPELDRYVNCISDHNVVVDADLLLIE